MRAVALLAVLVTLTACSKDEGPKVPLDGSGDATATQAGTLTPAARTALNEGNEAFRAKNYDAALAAYRRAAAESPQDVAPLWGIQMAARAMNNTKLADSATARMKELAPGNAAGVEGDPHVGVGKTDSTKLPAAHPPIGG